MASEGKLDDVLGSHVPVIAVRVEILVSLMECAGQAFVVMLGS